MVSVYTSQSSVNDTQTSPIHVEDRGLDLYALLAGIWSRKRMVFGIVSAITLVAVAYVLSATPQYTSETRVLISNMETPFTRAGVNPAQLTPVDPPAVLSEVQVLLSKDLALRAIKELKLFDIPEYKSGPGSFFSLSKVLTALGLAADRASMSESQRVLNKFSENLTIFTIPLSRVIAIGFTSNTPELSASVPDKLAQIYIQATREAKLDTTQHASKWLSGRVDTLRKELKVAEQSVVTFRSQAGLEKGGNGSTLGSQSLSELNSQITVAAGQKSTAQTSARNIRTLLRRKNGIASSAEVLQSNLIQRLVEQKVLLRRQSADLSARYLPAHPRIVRIRAEIRGLDRQIKLEIGKIAKSLDNQAQVASRRETALRLQLAQLKSRANVDNKEQVKLAALEREAKAKRELLEVYLGRLRDAAARQDVESQTPGARIISHAQVSNIPSFPKKGPIIMLAFLASLMIGITIAFLMEMFAIPASAVSAAPLARARPVKIDVGAPNTTRTTQRQTRPIAQVSVAGHITPAYADTKVALSPDPEIFGPIVHVLESNKSERNANCVLLASDTHHIGDMPAIIDLARALAHMEHSVLLVDANFSNPELAQALQQNSGAGLADLLQGHVTFTDVIVSDQNSRAHVMFAGTNPTLASNLLGAEPMDTLLEALSGAYDFVLIAGGQAGQFSDAQSLSSKVHSVMLLAQSETACQIALEVLSKTGQDDIAMILREQPATTQGLSRVFKA